jgi:hypothetical protein
MDDYHELSISMTSSSRLQPDADSGDRARPRLKQPGRARPLPRRHDAPQESVSRTPAPYALLIPQAHAVALPEHLGVDKLCR